MAPLVRFTDECEYLVDEAVRRGDHRLVGVPVEGNESTVWKRVGDRFRCVLGEWGALTAGQHQGRRGRFHKPGSIELVLSDRLQLAGQRIGSVHHILPDRCRTSRVEFLRRELGDFLQEQNERPLVFTVVQ